MTGYRVICTEWNYDFVSKRTGYEYIKRVDGFKENAQTLEKLGSGWIDWRDWDDTSLNELLDTLILDAKQKNYWWGIPDPEIKVTSVKLTELKIQLVSGASRQLTAIVYPALAGNQQITWTSSNSEIVSVNQSGVFMATAKKSGSASITVTTSDGNSTAQCEVKVTM